MNASRIAIMSNEDMGRYASGGFGVDKRDQFLATVRSMAKQLAQTQSVSPSTDTGGPHGQADQE